MKLLIMIVRKLGYVRVGGPLRAMEIPTIPKTAFVAYAFIKPFLWLSFAAISLIRFLPFKGRVPLSGTRENLQEALKLSQEATIGKVEQTAIIAPVNLPSERQAPLPVIIVDNFYPNPEEMRALALN